ncbi:T9SS C-terminal target domain-containing protein, partial [candidate division KSB1 bacterium]
KGLANKSSLIASLGHIYEFVEEPLPKALPQAQVKEAPEGFALAAYPNPFNPATQIRFSIPTASSASLRIFDVNGRLIRTWNLEQRAAGEHVILWEGNDENGRQVASGTYFAELIAAGRRQVTKMALIR